MQEFNKVTTTSNFIKQLLNTTYLPVIRTVQAGDYIVEGRQYIYRCDIINCLSSGYILPYDNATLSPKANYIRVGEYYFGDKNGKLCTNFQSNSEGYDSLTHERLGAYLRALRDMYALDLMPLYNCFSNNPLANYHVFNDRITKTVYNYHTKLYKVPIRFNTDYTICIENVGKTTFAPAFIRNEHLVKLNKTPIGDNIDVTNRYISLHTDTVISTYSGLRFFDPITIRFNNIPETKVVEYMKPTGNTRYTEAPILPSYFQLININEEIFPTIQETLYKLQNGQFVKVSTEESYNASSYYAECVFNPSEHNWYEEVSTTTTIVDGVEIETGTYELTTDTLIDLSKTYYLASTEMQTMEYTYNVSDIHCEMYDKIEDTLYLLIQVPQAFDSNIVILEGDYTHIQSTKYFNETDLRNFPENYLDKLFTHDLRLMRMNVPQIIPFSETLVQFLLWNVICGLDSINLDMDRLLQTLRNLYMIVDEKYYANYWYFRYRELISTYAKDNLQEFIDDNLGYVTTEIESLLNRG